MSRKRFPFGFYKQAVGLALSPLVLNLACGGGASAPSVQAPVAIAPVITQQPNDVISTAGDSVTFLVEANGKPDPAFQWRRAGVPLQGQTGPKLILPSVQATDEGGYDALVTNSAGSVTSVTANLIVQRKPRFLAQPVNQSVSAPGVAVFTVETDGKPVPTLQWQNSNGSQWFDISGATGTSCTTAATTLSMNGTQYRCVATNAAGSVTSDPAILLVNPIGQPTLSVTLGEGSTGSPAATAKYPKGTDVPYAYSLQPGYRDLKVSLDGATAPVSGNLRMDADHTLSVSSTPITYAVKFLAGPGGTVSGNAAQTVREGGDASTITALPETGYTFTSWTGSGITPRTENPLTLKGVTRDTTLTATFTKTPALSYTVTFTAGNGGSLTGNVVQTVQAGGSATAVTAVPAPGFSFVNWSGTGFPTSSSNPITVAKVQQNLALTATFMAQSGDLGCEVGKTPFEVEFIDAKGKASKLSDYKGKVILLVCSEVYCNPCQTEAKTIQALQDKYGAQGLVIIENLSDFGTHKVTTQDLLKWAADGGITTVPVTHDTNDLPTQYKITGYPTNILIGRDFKIKARQTGYSPYTVENMIIQGLK